MQLTRVEIEDYRAIDRLGIDLAELTTVIGEPDCGKSSLLRAIHAVLGPGADDGTPAFRRSDFHRPAGEETRARRLTITLTLRADVGDEAMPPELTPPRGEGALRVRAELPEAALRVRAEQPEAALRSRAEQPEAEQPEAAVRVRAELPEEEQPEASVRVRAELPGATDRVPAEAQDLEAVTSLEVLDSDGRPLPGIDAVRLLAELRRRHPAAVVGRPRTSARLAATAVEPHPASLRMRELLRGASEPAEPLTLEQLSDVHDDLERAVARIAEQLRDAPEPPRSVRQLADTPLLLETDLARALGQDAGTHRRIPALWLLVAIIQALPPEGLAEDAEPILLFDDIEANLHPTWLASLCSVAINLPFREVVTTHSSEVLAWLPLSSLRRLRRADGGLEARAVRTEALSDEDLRRLAYHVRLNRGGSLFARCWVLVEGETEAWLVPEFARLVGVEMPIDGIRCVEFAQCGLGPLLRVADDLGIRWVVLTDGDAAGQHYAQRTRRHLADGGDGTVITLPDADIEHYLYRNGYRDVIARAARRAPRGKPGPIIAAAVDNVSKPGLALQILAEADRRGPDGVPPVLRQLVTAASDAALRRG